MDLVAGVRKEGSRGGRDAFKWSDVKESSHRENYLGHSVMAPVGRWQKGRDLQWYANDKGDESKFGADRERAERKEEIRHIRETEQEAMAQALGLPVAQKTNANLTPLRNKEVQKVIQETTAGDDEGAGRGIGFGSYGGEFSRIGSRGDDERLEAIGVDVKKQPNFRARMGRSRSPVRERRRGQSRIQDRNRDKDRQRRHRREGYEDERYRHERRRRSMSKSRDPEEARYQDHRRRRSSPHSWSRDKRRDNEYDRSHHRSLRDQRGYPHNKRERDLEHDRHR